MWNLTRQEESEPHLKREKGREGIKTPLFPSTLVKNSTFGIEEDDRRSITQEEMDMLDEHNDWDDERETL
jgi:hypothetical protein